MLNYDINNLKDIIDVIDFGGSTDKAKTAGNLTRQIL